MRETEKLDHARIGERALKADELDAEVQRRYKRDFCQPWQEEWRELVGAAQLTGRLFAGWRPYVLPALGGVQMMGLRWNGKAGSAFISTLSGEDPEGIIHRAQEIQELGWVPR